MLLLRGRWKKAITQHVYFRLAPRGFGFAAAVAPVEPMPVKGAVLAAPNVGAGVPKSEVVAVGVPKSEFVAAGVPKSEDVAAGVPKSEDVDAGAPKSEGVCVAGAPEEAPNNPVEGVVEVPNNPPGVVGGVEPCNAGAKDDPNNDCDEAPAAGVVLDAVVLKIEGAGVVGVENKVGVVAVNAGC